MKYLKGLFIKNPKEKAPDFVLADGSIKVKELIETLQATDDEWINFQVKKWDKDGENKIYYQIDTYKKEKQGGDEDLPW